jgi:hypothetical protein
MKFSDTPFYVVPVDKIKVATPLAVFDPLWFPCVTSTNQTKKLTANQQVTMSPHRQRLQN